MLKVTEPHICRSSADLHIHSGHAIWIVDLSCGLKLADLFGISCIPTVPINEHLILSVEGALRLLGALYCSYKW